LHTLEVGKITVRSYFRKYFIYFQYIYYLLKKKNIYTYNNNRRTAVIGAFNLTKEDECNVSPEHFMISNTATGKEDVYTKPISPKPTLKVPPDPPPRTMSSKEKTLKFANKEKSSESIYDNPISYQTNNVDSSVQKTDEQPPTIKSVLNKENKSKGIFIIFVKKKTKFCIKMIK
jgi:hypothetical protein